MKRIILLISFIFVSMLEASPFRILTDDWAPYEYQENGEITGFATEILLEVFKEMGLEYTKPEIVPWSRGESYVFNGIADILYSGTKDKKRLANTYFPDEMLIQSDWIFFIRKTDEKKFKFESFEDLKGKRIGLMQDYAYTTELWDFVKSQGNFETVTEEALNFRKLVRGRVDYIIAEYAVGSSLVKKLDLEDKIVPIKEKPVISTGLYYMFSKTTVDKSFVDEFSLKLREFKKSKKYEKLYNKYF